MVERTNTSDAPWVLVEANDKRFARLKAMRTLCDARRMKGTTMTEAVYTGGCMCGAVRFEARGEPVRAGMCHCTTCRRNTGSAFAVYAVFPAERLRMLGDETGSYATSDRLRRHFCRVCGAPAFVEEQGEMIVHLGAFDGAEAFAPTYELYTFRRLPWLPRMPGRESYERDRD